MIGVYLAIAFIISILLFFNRNKTINYTLVICFVVLQCGFTFYEYLHINIPELYYFTPDALALLMLITLTIISIAAMYHSFKYLSGKNDIPKHTAIYFSAMVVLLTAVSAAYLSNHIAVTWIFVEITTLSASALIYHRRNNRSLEGTWKYVFVCAISLTLVFVGILFLSFALKQAGSDNLSYDILLTKAHGLNIFWLQLAFIFIFTGFSAKLGLVPMYTAGIDAKDKAPSPAGALFSSVLINMGFVAIFRFYIIISHTTLHSWANHVIIIAAILSIFVATVYMTKVKNIKRMLDQLISANLERWVEASMICSASSRSRKDLASASRLPLRSAIGTVFGLPALNAFMISPRTSIAGRAAPQQHRGAFSALLTWVRKERVDQFAVAPIRPSAAHTDVTRPGRTSTQRDRPTTGESGSSRSGARRWRPWSPTCRPAPRGRPRRWRSR